MGLTLRGAGGQCAAATAGFRRREFAGDRCASCGSPCVHAGRSASALGEQNRPGSRETLSSQQAHQASGCR